MHDRGKEHVEVGEPVDVRFKTRHMLGAMRKVLGMPSPEKTSPSQHIRNSPRLAVQLPFTYRAIKNDAVMPDTFRGTILNIGYQGMLAELKQPLPDDSEIKLNLDTLLTYAKATDLDASAAEIYAKVINTRPIDSWNVSGIAFTCVSAQNEKLLMHCMMHIAHADNTLIDEHLRRHEQQVTKKIEAWRVAKRVILITLLAVSSALFYLLSILDEALTVVR